MLSPPLQRQPSGQRRILPIFLLCLLVPAPTLLATNGTDPQSSAALPHQPTYFHLPAGTSLVLTLSAKTCRQAEILIETSAPGTDFVLVAPGGRQLQAIDATKPGWFVLWFPCAPATAYRLIARAAVMQDKGGGISLHVDYLPWASFGDDRAHAAALFVDANALAGSPHATPLHTAIDKYRQAAMIWATLGDREGQLLAVAGEAGAWLNLSEYDNALAALNRARLLSLQIPFFRAWLTNLLAEIYLDRWDSGLALCSGEKAVRLSRSLADPWLTADAFVDRAEAEYLIDDPADDADIEQALTMSRESDAEETLARALRCKSWIVGDEGHVTPAMVFMRQAEAEFRAAGQIRNAVDAMANLATIQGMNGDHYAALVSHAALIPLIRESGKLADLAFLLVNTADDYMELNRVPDAIAHYPEAVGIFRKIGLLSGESISVSQLCVAEQRADRLHNAMRDCLHSRAIAEQLHDPRRLAITILRLGDVQRAAGKTAQAALSFRQACDISESAHDPRSQAQAMMDWGDVLENLGDREQARQKFSMAFPLAQMAENVPEQIEARLRIARSEFEAGEDEKSKSDLNKALKSIDNQRRSVANPDLQASYFAQLHKCHELYVELLMREYERDPASDGAMEALDVSESGRALTLLDALAARRQSFASPPPAPHHELLAMQMAVQHAYDQRLRLMLEDAHKGELDANEGSLTQAIDALERAEDEHRAASSPKPELGSPLKASEIVADSKRLNSTLVEFALGADHSYVWVIDHGKFESHVLPARSEIEFAVKQWRALATARIASSGSAFVGNRKPVSSADVELPKAAARLSCMILAPFLRPGMVHLTIVPDEELNLFPFAALPEKGCEGGTQPLAANLQIVLAPSLSILLLSHQPATRDSWRGEIALIADPVFDAGDPRVHTAHFLRGKDAERNAFALPRLYGTRDEAMAIAALAGSTRSALYLDFDANLQTFLAPSFGEYRILHLATHGILDQSAPDLSGIVLSLVDRDGQRIFGYLNPHDVENLNLRSELVVLSSCDSGAGPNFSGEGVTGLNHAFLAAGAARVLSTLWSVDDETSKELMVEFYRGILRDGLTEEEALRRSQLQIMRNPSTAAPFYWAGFTLTTTIP
jgi:tetratricopeptide (TPR) repeat protein